MAVAEPGAVVLAPEPSFVMYRVIAGFVQMKYVGVPLQEVIVILEVLAHVLVIERGIRIPFRGYCLLLAGGHVW